MASNSADGPGTGPDRQGSRPVDAAVARAGSGVDVAPGGDVMVGGLELGAVAAALGGVDGGALRDLGARQAVEVLALTSRLRSALMALENQVIVALDDRLREAAPPETSRRAGRATAHHVAMAARVSPSVASRRVAAACRLVHDLPRVHWALATGRLPEASAVAIGTTTGPLAPTLRRQVDDVIAEHLPYLEDASVRQWEHEIDLIAHRLDPDSFARRHAGARLERSVHIVRGAHGMARLHATLAGIDAAAIGKKLSVEAERLRAAGDRRGHGQAMADLLADTLLGRDEAMDPIRLDVGVIITDRVLLAGRTGDATIEGYGTIPADTAVAAIESAAMADPQGRESRAVWRRLYTHPDRGELVAVESRARTFPRALARMIRMGQIGCAGPYCGAPIRHLDHLRSVADGGATTLANGAGSCARCNWMRELMARVRALDGPAGRVIEWTSSLGITTHRTGTPLEGRRPLTPSEPGALAPAADDGPEPASRVFPSQPVRIIRYESRIEARIAALLEKYRSSG